ncbi:pyridoxamine 5'-phosphate oxidase family protein [Cyanobium sp. ATX-6F1]|uniref:pyridoxamine 5'-phosphate oxidase family protein n=1 Tax=Cyanobium sp. ATX-6F1 TaxID=3137388 RepID=UPI0039BEA05E
MTQHYLHRHLTPAVGEAQRQAYGQSQAVPPAPESDRLGAKETAFIQARDSFYLASLTETGAPYLQHRGGPVGFLKVLDDHTLGFADYGGNRQLLTTGHLRRDPRVALFLMDYGARRRLKIDGEAAVVSLEGDPALRQRLWLDEPEAGEPERLFRIQVEAFDWNCPQFITPVTRRRSWRRGNGLCGSASRSLSTSGSRLSIPFANLRRTNPTVEGTADGISRPPLDVSAESLARGPGAQPGIQPPNCSSRALSGASNSWKDCCETGSGSTTS